MLEHFLTIAVLAALAAASPGPDFAIVLRNSIAHSRSAGMYTALGIAIGLCVHVTYSLVGIGLIISQSAVLFNIIKWLGAGYLVYLGVLALLTNRRAKTVEGERYDDIAPAKAFRAGFLTNVLNPKVTLFFLAVFTQIIGFDTPLIIRLALGVEIVLVALTWFSLVSFMATTEGFKVIIGRAQPTLEKIMGVALVALGLKVAFFSQK